MEQQQNTTQGTTVTPEVVLQRARQAFNQANGPLSTDELMQRPWFRDNNVQGPATGRAISALVRAHEIRKIKDRVYVSASSKTAHGTPASSSKQAKQGNGTLSQSAQKRMTAQTRKPAQRATSNTVTGRQWAQGTAKQPQNAAGLMSRISTLEQQVAQLTQFIYGNS